MSGGGAVLYLVVTEGRNRLRRKGARIRSPRYAIGLAIGIAYFWLVFFRPGAPQSEATPPGLDLFFALGLATLTAFWWVRGGQERWIAFAPAEVNLLFTAPLTRRQLLHLKLLRIQQGVLFSALLFTLFTRGSPVPWPARLLGLWVMVNTITLHPIAASLVRANAASRSGLRRSALPLVVFAAAATALILGLAQDYAFITAAATPEAMFERARDALETGPAGMVLFPFRAVLGPLSADSLSEWARAIPLALAIMLLHYVWILRTDAAFEEAAAEAGRKRAEALEAVRSGHVAAATGGGAWSKRRRLRIPLAPTGTPEVAVLWKNTVMALRTLRPLTMLAMIAIAVALFIAIGILNGDPTAAAQQIATLSLVMAGGALLLGPQSFRYDLRRDLTKLEVLRTWPVGGGRFVAAQVAVSAAALLLVIYGLLALAAAAHSVGSLQVLSPAMLAIIGGGLLLTLPPIVFLAMLIQNGLALTFPAWSKLGAGEPGGGIEFMGQFLMAVVISLSLLALGLAAPLLLAGAVAAPTYAALGRWVAVPAGAVFIAGLWIEAGLLTRYLGRVYERLDPADVGLLR